MPKTTAYVTIDRGENASVVSGDRGVTGRGGLSESNAADGRYTRRRWGGWRRNATRRRCGAVRCRRVDRSHIVHEQIVGGGHALWVLVTAHGIFVSQLGDEGSISRWACAGDERNCECLLASFGKSFLVS